LDGLERREWTSKKQRREQRQGIEVDTLMGMRHGTTVLKSSPPGLAAGAPSSSLASGRVRSAPAGSSGVHGEAKDNYHGYGVADGRDDQEVGYQGTPFGLFRLRLFR
jgi:hypothetical protein